MNPAALVPQRLYDSPVGGECDDVARRCLIARGREKRLVPAVPLDPPARWPGAAKGYSRIPVQMYGRLWTEPGPAPPSRATPDHPARQAPARAVHPAAGCLCGVGRGDRRVLETPLTLFPKTLANSHISRVYDSAQSGCCAPRFSNLVPGESLSCQRSRDPRAPWQKRPRARSEHPP